MARTVKDSFFSQHGSSIEAVPERDRERRIIMKHCGRSIGLLVVLFLVALGLTFGGVPRPASAASIVRFQFSVPEPLRISLGSHLDGLIADWQLQFDNP